MNLVFLFSHKVVMQKRVTLIPFKCYNYIKNPGQFQTAEVGGYLMFYDVDGERYRGRR